MTKLVIRVGDAVDTIEVDTKAKLMAAIKSGLPDILPETVTILVNRDDMLADQPKKEVTKEEPPCADALWNDLRDVSVLAATKMVKWVGASNPSATMANAMASIHQLINVARRAEKRAIAGPGDNEPLLLPKSTAAAIDNSKAACKASKQAAADAEAMDEL